MKKYPIGTLLRWKNNHLHSQYAIKIAGYHRNKYVIEWTAKVDNVEGRKKGQKWNTNWMEKDITDEMQCQVQIALRYPSCGTIDGNRITSLV